MMPAEPTATLTRVEPLDVKAVTAVAISQESAPIGSTSSNGFHIFTISLHVDPQAGEYKPGKLHYEFKAPTGWKWVDWASYYYYDEQNYKTTVPKVLQTDTSTAGMLAFDLDSHLNSGAGNDVTRLCFTLMVIPVAGTAPKRYDDGSATVTGGSDSKLLPKPIILTGITT
ncbi:hypothetical protein [Kitasatospora sp. NPDC005856]|uniref:hypothetical protein n=1 Tax=Kitasatospora sp. NPDC005856 TaxID=3154566 RepID=UPI0034088E22